MNATAASGNATTANVSSSGEFQAWRREFIYDLTFWFNFNSDFVHLWVSQATSQTVYYILFHGGTEQPKHPLGQREILYLENTIPTVLLTQGCACIF